MIARVNVAITALPRTFSSSQLVPCTTPVIRRQVSQIKAKQRSAKNAHHCHTGQPEHVIGAEDFTDQVKPRLRGWTPPPLQGALGRLQIPELPEGGLSRLQSALELQPAGGNVWGFSPSAWAVRFAGHRLQLTHAWRSQPCMALGCMLHDKQSPLPTAPLEMKCSLRQHQEGNGKSLRAASHKTWYGGASRGHTRPQQATAGSSAQDATWARTYD